MHVSGTNPRFSIPLEWGVHAQGWDAPCEKSWKQGNPLSNTIKDTSTTMRNPFALINYVGRGYAYCIATCANPYTYVIAVLPISIADSDEPF